MNPPIYICQSDANLLTRLLDSPESLKGTDKAVADRLRQELQRAVILQDPDLPKDVISLNSTAELEDLAEKEVDEFTLVLPGRASIDQARISVLAPLGAGMLGFKTGDEFQWATPSGMVTYRVRKVTRPAPKPAAALDRERSGKDKVAESTAA